MPLTTSQIKDLVNKYIKKWTPILGLENQRIKLRWKNERLVAESGLETLMNTLACWHLLQATITMYIPSLKALDKEELELTVVHELLHVVLDEMREYDEKHLERVCETMARSFVRLAKK